MWTEKILETVSIMISSNDNKQSNGFSECSPRAKNTIVKI